MDYTVEFVSNYVSAIDYATVQTKDSTIPKGETKVITAGSNGSVYESYRVYKKNGEEYDRKFESRSRYQPVTAEVAVGTMEEEPGEEEITEEEITEENIPSEENPEIEKTPEDADEPVIPEEVIASDTMPAEEETYTEQEQNPEE